MWQRKLLSLSEISETCPWKGRKMRAFYPLIIMGSYCGRISIVSSTSAFGGTLLGKTRIWENLPHTDKFGGMSKPLIFMTNSLRYGCVEWLSKLIKFLHFQLTAWLYMIFIRTTNDCAFTCSCQIFNIFILSRFLACFLKCQ